MFNVVVIFWCSMCKAVHVYLLHSVLSTRHGINTMLRFIFLLAPYDGIAITVAC